MLEALELLVLAAAPWPLYRALTLASFRRHYARFAVGMALEKRPLMDVQVPLGDADGEVAECVR